MSYNNRNNENSNSQNNNSFKKLTDELFDFDSFAPFKNFINNICKYRQEHPNKFLSIIIPVVIIFIIIIVSSAASSDSNKKKHNNYSHSTYSYGSYDDDYYYYYDDDDDDDYYYYYDDYNDNSYYYNDNNYYNYGDDYYYYGDDYYYYGDDYYNYGDDYYYYDDYDYSYYDKKGYKSNYKNYDHYNEYNNKYIYDYSYDYSDYKISLNKTEKNKLLKVYNNIGTNSNSSLDIFCDYLQKTCSNFTDEEKIYFIYYWITHNIKYDLANYFSGKKSDNIPKSLFINKTTDSSGYSKLFTHL